MGADGGGTAPGRYTASPKYFMTNKHKNEVCWMS